MKTYLHWRMPSAPRIGLNPNLEIKNAKQALIELCAGFSLTTMGPESRHPEVESSVIVRQHFELVQGFYQRRSEKNKDTLWLTGLGMMLFHLPIFGEEGKQANPDEIFNALLEQEAFRLEGVDRSSRTPLRYQVGRLYTNDAAQAAEKRRPYSWKNAMTFPLLCADYADSWVASAGYYTAIEGNVFRAVESMKVALAIDPTNVNYLQGLTMLERAAKVPMS